MRSAREDHQAGTLLDPPRADGLGRLAGIEEREVLVAHLHHVRQSHEFLDALAHDLARHSAGSGIGVVAQREVSRAVGRAPGGKHVVHAGPEPAHQRARVPSGRTRGSCCGERLGEVRRVPHEIGAALVVEVVAHRAIVLPRAHREQARARAAQQGSGRQAVVDDRAIEQRGKPVVAGTSEQHGLAAQAAYAEGDIGRGAAGDRAVGLRILAGHEVDDALTEDGDHGWLHGAEPTEALAA